MRVEGLEQNTPEWIVHRVGMVTASRASDVMSFLKKGGESAERRRYRQQLIIETLTGRAFEHFVTPAMEDGLMNEPLAVAAYEMATDVEAEDGGFWMHDKISRFGASPDRLIGYDGLLECKCPTPIVHWEIRKSRQIPPEYQWQMLAQMACTGREWCDFVSFYPHLPEQYQLFIKRFPRDNERIAELEAGIERFLLEVAAEINEDLTPVLEASLQEASH